MDCFRSQRYKILKPIHNKIYLVFLPKTLFQITKIQNFETNSQQLAKMLHIDINCFRSQRYKILKPIHNVSMLQTTPLNTVSDHKDTKFWNQFTTTPLTLLQIPSLFQITKIQNFETNSQHCSNLSNAWYYCFRSQRYKILKPIHNLSCCFLFLNSTVSDHKDTKFWNQFTTLVPIMFYK
mgnify:CR=1 FL=1